MLVSVSHNFVFIHIAKNGGSSVNEMLLQYCVGGERTKIGDVLSVFPYAKAPERLGYPPHANARWARRNLGPRFYDRAFSFAIVRNPYDRAVSRFEYVRQNAEHHNNQKFQNLSFGGFVSDERMRNLVISRTQYSEISSRSGEVIVDKIYRFEEIDAAVSDICTRLGLPKPAQTPHQNRSRRGHYQSYFTPEIRARFERIYRKDIEYFEYDF